jgi:integrase
MSVNRRVTNRGAVYDVRLRTVDGSSYKRSFRTRREAEVFEARERADRSRGTWLDPRRAEVTFDDLAREWLANNPAKRPGTLARDEGIVRLHLEPALGPRPLGTITPGDVQTLVNRWSKRQKPRTVRRQFGVVRAVFRFAVERDYIGRTPCRGIKLPEVEHATRRVVTSADLERLAVELGPNHAAMAYLGAVLGLRWGECAGLRVGRIDFLRSTLIVAEQITRGQGGRHVSGPPKSQAGRRTLAMPTALAALLTDHLARRRLTGADSDALVFVSKEGGPIRYERWRGRVWLPAVRRAGLEGLTFHDLRRANATALVLDGVDLKTAQTRLGHSDPRLTLAVYAQATSEADRAAADALGRRFLDARAMNAP